MNELLPRKMFSQRLEESPAGRGTVKLKARGKALYETLLKVTAPFSRRLLPSLEAVK